MKKRDEKMRLRYQQREEKRFADMLYERKKLEKYWAEREVTDKERLENEMVKRLLALKEKMDDR